MNAELFVQRFLAVLHTANGWDEPLTMERLHRLLTLTLAEYHEEIYK